MPSPTTPAGRAARLLPLALALAAASPLLAQIAPGTPPREPAPAVVELSPFEVNTSRDVGYAAENTLAGSRLNARLRDTAGSVSVFTKECK